MSAWLVLDTGVRTNGSGGAEDAPTVAPDTSDTAGTGVSDTAGTGASDAPGTGAVGPRLDAAGAQEAAGFFAVAAAALQFPDYFGANWDAFEECLADADPPGLVITHAEALLRDDPRALTVLIAVLRDRGRPVVLDVSSADADDLNRRLAAAGVTAADRADR